MAEGFLAVLATLFIIYINVEYQVGMFIETAF